MSALSDADRLVAEAQRIAQEVIRLHSKRRYTFAGSEILTDADIAAPVLSALQQAQAPASDLEELRSLVDRWSNRASDFGYYGQPFHPRAEAFKECAGELAAALLERGRPLEIDCPLCGETVKQVASATLSLALWQHCNWTCPKREQSQPRPEIETPSQREQDYFTMGQVAEQIKSSQRAPRERGERAPICSHCRERPAVCLGQYDNMLEPDYACDTCCGHGCEDGRCFRLPAPPAPHAEGRME